MDPDIEELKDLVKKSLAASEETNKIVRSMRRGQRWSHFFTILWWAIIIASSGFAYVFLKPYVAQVVDLYQGGQEMNQQGQSIIQGIGERIKEFLPGNGTASSTGVN